MNDKLFFDTNVLVYCYTDTEPDKKNIAVSLAQSPEAWVSTQVLQDLSNKIQKKFTKDWKEVAATIEEVCKNFIVFTNEPSTLLDAVQIANRYGYSLYDCLIISSALTAGCSILYSEDMQHGQLIDEKLKIINPFLP